MIQSLDRISLETLMTPAERLIGAIYLYLPANLDGERMSMMRSRILSSFTDSSFSKDGHTETYLNNLDADKADVMILNLILMQMDTIVSCLKL